MTAERPLKVAIVAAGLTSREVAAQVGLSEAYFSKVVNGRHVPAYEKRLEIAAALKRHPDDLFPDVSHPVVVLPEEEAA